MENSAGTGKHMSEFERTYFERLRLAAQVILEAAPDLELVTDPLEVELPIDRTSGRHAGGKAVLASA
jgi:hypothetical protein